jgi:hypothetical protein
MKAISACGTPRFTSFSVHVIINGEALVLDGVDRSQKTSCVRRSSLRRLPNAVNVFDGQIDFALRVVLGRGQHQPQIESGLAALARDFEHIIFRRINALGFGLWARSTSL